MRELKKVKHRVTGEEGPLYMPFWEFFDVVIPHGIREAQTVS